MLLLILSALFCTSAASAVEPACVADGIYVGAEPANNADWIALQHLGIRTVVGVDGLPPDRVAAEAAGMRVVHVPIGYGAIPEDALDQLAAVARDCERPVYVYCHHGQHRGPAAAAIVGRAAGLLDRDGALDLLRTAGTDPAYGGLWKSVANFDPTRPVPARTRLVPQSEVSPLRLAMGQLDRAWDAAASDEASPSQREAALVVARQALRESRRGAVADSASAGLLHEFDTAIRRFDDLADDGPDRLRRFEQACAECHRRHRD